MRAGGIGKSLIEVQKRGMKPTGDDMGCESRRVNQSGMICVIWNSSQRPGERNTVTRGTKDAICNEGKGIIVEIEDAP